MIRWRWPVALRPIAQHPYQWHRRVPVGRRFFRQALHEFQDMALVIHGLRRDNLFVDIGANIGILRLRVFEHFGNA